MEFQHLGGPLNGDLRMRRRVEPYDQFFTHSHKLCCYDVIPVVVFAIVRTMYSTNPCN